MHGLLDLNRRNALVTGAGQGVGREAALYFAAHNAGTVVVNDFVLARAEAVAREIEDAGGNALPMQCDVTDYAAVMRMFEDAAGQIGGIDILVNNAGNAGATSSLDDLTPFWESDPEEWKRWIGTNLYGVLNNCRAAIPGMIERKGGRIVTVVSDAGRVGEGHLAVYSGAKAGAAGFMRGIARAVGRYGITANCVSLAGVVTPGVQGLIPDDVAIAKAVKSYVIRRLGQPSDAAGMILYLASDAAAWITGQTYPVNGGYSFAV